MGETFSEMTKIIPMINATPKTKDLMEAFPKTIQFELDGEESSFLITIQGGQMKLTQGISEKADIVVTGDTKEFAKVVRGKVDVTHPIARGQITVKKGKISDMTLLNRILWAIERR